MKALFPTYKQPSSCCVCSWQTEKVNSGLSSASCMYVCSVASVVSDSEIPWIVAHQAPLSTGFPRQEYWCGLPCPPPGDLPHLGIEPVSPKSPALAGRFFIHWATWEAPSADAIADAIIKTLIPPQEPHPYDLIQAYLSKPPQSPTS